MPTFVPHETVYTVMPARYSKGMMAVRCPSPDSWKTEAGWMAQYHANDRFTGREGAYIMSPERARQFEALMKAGFTVRSFGGPWKLYNADGVEIPINGPEHKMAKAKPKEVTHE